MKIKHNKVYEFNLQGSLSFGDLNDSSVIEVLSDGRVSSHFLERHLPLWFPELKFVSGCKDHDHIHESLGLKYDQKCFTRRGCRFMPSSMIGAGRKFNEEKFLEKSNKLIYIICDITELPKVQVMFKDGATLAQKYPNGVIHFKERERFFSSQKMVDMQHG